MMNNKNYRNNRNQNKNENREEYAIVLDVITNQRSFRNSQTIQAVGKTGFGLLELVPKEGVEINNGDEVYIGNGKREEIQYIKRALKFEDLTGTSQSELQYAIMDILDEREEEFINFFNNAGPITIRKHSLELIPGIGKKHLQELLEEREKGAFKSFNDLKERCSFLSDPQKALSERIIQELKNKEDIKIFVKK